MELFTVLYSGEVDGFGLYTTGGSALSFAHQRSLHPRTM